jgi:hypothetical protein
MERTRKADHRKEEEERSRRGSGEPLMTRPAPSSNSNGSLPTFESKTLPFCSIPWERHRVTSTYGRNIKSAKYAEAEGHESRVAYRVENFHHISDPSLTATVLRLVLK